MAQTGRSAIGHGASTKNTAGREKRLARGAQNDVEWAALEHQWGMLAIDKAHLALMAVDNVEMEYQYDSVVRRMIFIIAEYISCSTQQGLN